MQLKDGQPETQIERVWLKSYPPGVPAEINPDAYHSIVDVMQQTCLRFHDKPAYANMGIHLSFSDLDRLSRYFAAYLQQVFHIKKGDRFAIMLPNLLQYPVAMLGILRAGGVVVNVNPLYTADELSHQINNSGAVGILILENFADTLQKALPSMPGLKHVVMTKLGDLFPAYKAWMVHFALKYIYRKIPTYTLPMAIAFKTSLAKGKAVRLDPVALTGEDTAFLQYTGGTTGVAKGAILTHRNIIANLQQADAWFKGLLNGNQEIIITALPLYHIFSLTANGLFFSKMGGLNVLITNPRDLPSMIKDMSRYPFTTLSGVNTLFNGLLKNPNFAKLDFSHLRLTLGGGMAVQKVVAEHWQTVTGAPLLEAYGLTETSPCVTINPWTLKAYNGSIGLPVSSTLVAILDEKGQALPLGQAGELAVKGPQVMKGYWQNPEETAKVFTQDGWLLTGDMATMDEHGYVRLLERKKDMILVSGFNVYPNEVEGVIARLPGVKECAVIGVPDENSGEVVKAFIVKDNPDLTAEAVIAFCRQYLTGYKMPKHVEFRDELPKTNVGKILRRALH
jgi:long-chain acyl-CoA synthetase